ncbi:2-dehydro-3-deoxygalactonokinase [Sphingomonas zeicaulis]|uniref:2-dehydro-3-deoxygalactonokinase n=1 Tax=Sphingomonas zeicaulis TaxID=1632740 RepID=UPI003D2346DF
MMPILAIEWGTARLRARLIEDQSVRATEEEEVRLADLDRASIAKRIATLADQWPDGARGGILLSGMIGSALGWTEVARIPCPASASAIARGAWRDRIAGHPVNILPGLFCRTRFGDPDVLRGEEIAAVGALGRIGRDAATLVCVPGMHGKWLRLADGCITDFHSAMTVELHRAIAHGTILSPLMRDAPDGGSAAFARGVTLGAAGGGLARLLFSARAAVQADILDAADASAYLWGVLIGADIREGIDRNAGSCLVTGAPAVAPLFVGALRMHGIAATLLDDDALTAAGFAMLAAQLSAPAEQRG